MKRLGLVLALALAALLVGCPKKTAPTDAAPAAFVPLAADAAPPARSPEIDDLWARANDEDGGTDDDLARLARREGVAGLIERGAHPAWRRAAARALGHTEGFYALAWLAEVGGADDEGDALAALESAVELSAQPRRATDPEDAEEIRSGCEKLGAIAKSASDKQRRRKILAARALRMLSDKGCAREIPSEADAR